MQKTKLVCKIVAAFIFLSAAAILPAEENRMGTPFSQGVNMTTWFELWSPGQGNLNYYNKTDIENVKSLGADVIRLPVHFDNLSSGAPDYKINALTLEYLDKVADWCEELHMYLVIDNHSFNSGTYPSAGAVDKSLQKIWPQIASRYKNRSSFIIYEILNEPNHIDNAVWNRIQEKALKTIRAYDKTHTVVVTGADWGSIRALEKIQLYDDANLIYTFHWYSPFVFTHQGASWANKEEEALSAIPFPYDEKRMPPVPKEIKGTWMENELKSKYPADGTEKAMRDELTIAYNFSRKNNVPVWCGEMGTYDLRSQPEDRVRWYKTAGALLREMDIPFTVWGYGGSFGLFKKNTREVYPYDLNAEVLEGLGFNVPAEAGSSAPVTDTQIKLPYVIFDDLPQGRTEITVWEGKGGTKPVLLASGESPAEGMYCIRWGNCSQYGSVNFNFGGPEDFSAALAADAHVSFSVRSSNPNQIFEVRFMNEDTPESKPWRMTYIVSSKDFPADGKWHTVTIPLSSMKETGAWSNDTQTWYDAEGLFDWHGVRTIQFSAEQGDIPGDLFIDDIKIAE